MSSFPLVIIESFPNLNTKSNKVFLPSICNRPLKKQEVREGQPNMIGRSLGN